MDRITCPEYAIKTLNLKKPSENSFLHMDSVIERTIPDFRENPISYFQSTEQSFLLMDASGTDIKAADILNIPERMKNSGGRRYMVIVFGIM